MAKRKVRVKHPVCEHGDHDVPTIRCGAPLPCPYHTVIVDTTVDPPTVAEPLMAKLRPRPLRRVHDIAKAIGKRPQGT